MSVYRFLLNLCNRINYNTTKEHVQIFGHNYNTMYIRPMEYNNNKKKKRNNNVNPQSTMSNQWELSNAVWLHYQYRMDALSLSGELIFITIRVLRNKENSKKGKHLRLYRTIPIVSSLTELRTKRLCIDKRYLFLY